MRRLVRLDQPSAQIVEAAVEAADEPVESAAAAAGGSVEDADVGSLATIFAIRRAVFVTEQAIDSAIEWDGLDTTATHLLGLVADRPVGTARLRWVDDATAKCERVAVRPADRGAGWGGWLMDALAERAAEAGASRCVLHAQQAVAGFYEKQGYRRVGEPFLEADIPHIKMVCHVGDAVADTDSNVDTDVDAAIDTDDDR